MKRAFFAALGLAAWLAMTLPAGQAEADLIRMPNPVQASFFHRTPTAVPAGTRVYTLGIDYEPGANLLTETAAEEGGKERLAAGRGRLRVECTENDWGPAAYNFFGWVADMAGAAGQWVTDITVATVRLPFYLVDALTGREAEPDMPAVSVASLPVAEVGRNGLRGVKVIGFEMQGNNRALLHLVASGDDSPLRRVTPEERCSYLQMETYQTWIDYRATEFARRMVETETWIGMSFTSYDLLRISLFFYWLYTLFMI